MELNKYERRLIKCVRDGVLTTIVTVSLIKYCVNEKKEDYLDQRIRDVIVQCTGDEGLNNEQLENLYGVFGINVGTDTISLDELSLYSGGNDLEELLLDCVND